MSRLAAEHLAFAYGSNMVLDGVSFEVEPGSFFAVMGPNGSGKSTLLGLLAGLLRPLRGRVTVDGGDLHALSIPARAERMAFVRQDTTSAFDYTVEEVVMMARFWRQKRFLYERPEDFEAVRTALQAAEVDHLAERPINHLSGGERQRVFIARALAQETPILLLDEPTSHLDLRHQIGIFELLGRLRREQGKTVVLISHDLNLTRRYADRALLLGCGPGEAQLGAAGEVLVPETVERVFGVKTALVEGPGGAFLVPRGE